MSRWLKYALIPVIVFAALLFLGTVIPSFIEWRIATPDTWEAKNRAGLVAFWIALSFIGCVFRFVHFED